MRLTRSGRSRAAQSRHPAASLLTEKPTPSGRTCTSKRPFETSIPTKTSCNAIILSPSCDCGREPRQLFGREMKGSAGALLDTGENPTIAYGRGAAAARTWPRPALRRALWTIAQRQDCFAEPDLGRRIAPTRGLAMTGSNLAGNWPRSLVQHV